MNNEMNAVETAIYATAFANEFARLRSGPIQPLTAKTLAEISVEHANWVVRLHRQAIAK
jgi:hypothetical protein